MTCRIHRTPLVETMEGTRACLQCRRDLRREFLSHTKSKDLRAAAVLQRLADPQEGSQEQ